MIAVSGAPKRDFADRRVSEELEALMTDRATYTATPDTPPLYPVSGYEKEAALAFPIIGSGDVSGSVVLMLREDGSMPTAEETKLLQVAASFLGKQMED